MATSSDFNILCPKAPRDMLQITKGTNPWEGALKMINPATWVRAIVRQHKQGKNDLKQLMDQCGDIIDWTD